MTVEIDRSRIKAANNCPCSRWLGYEIYGKGLERRKIALPLKFGDGFHQGAERLLIGDVEGAVLAGDKCLTDAFNGAGVDFGDESSSDEQRAREYGMAEQRALCEAVIRAWDAWEGDRFRRDFEIVEIEQEGRADLDGQFLLMFRADAVVKERMSGDHYIVSWKTRYAQTARSARQDRRDIQSCSEAFGVEHARGIKVEGILYKIIIKGKRDKDEWDGLYKQNSALVYGWMKLGDDPSETEWSWKYSWTDESEINPKTGKPVGHKLGKGWKKVPVWENYPGGVKGWVEDLASQKVSPRHLNALESFFPDPLPVERRPDEIESWRRQTIAQEEKRKVDADFMRTLEVGSEEYKIELDKRFPKNSDRCEDYSGCAMRGICWDGVDPVEGELYQIRVANHPERGEDNG